MEQGDKIDEIDEIRNKFFEMIKKEEEEKKKEILKKQKECKHPRNRRGFGRVSENVFQSICGDCGSTKVINYYPLGCQIV